MTGSGAALIGGQQVMLGNVDLALHLLRSLPADAGSGHAS